eukprot:scaffold7956_cov32-Tisochrysis_lutea.AAC.2
MSPRDGNSSHVTCAPSAMSEVFSAVRMGCAGANLSCGGCPSECWSGYLEFFLPGKTCKRLACGFTLVQAATVTRSRGHRPDKGLPKASTTCTCIGPTILPEIALETGMRALRPCAFAGATRRRDDAGPIRTGAS